MSEILKCPNSSCGALVAPGAAFCSQCGTKLESRCPNPQCGAALRGGENFCTKCGTRLTASAKVPSSREQEETTKTRTSKARIYMFPTDKGGRHAPIFPGYRPDLISKGSNQKVKVEFVDGFDMIMPGQSGTANLRMLDSGFTLKKGDTFTISEEITPNPDDIALRLDFKGLGPVGELEIL